MLNLILTVYSYHSKLKPVWFVCKAICFFDFLLDDSEDGKPTHLVLGEVLEGCKEQDIADGPRVKETTSNRKFVACF